MQISYTYNSIDAAVNALLDAEQLQSSQDETDEISVLIQRISAGCSPDVRPGFESFAQARWLW